MLLLNTGFSKQLRLQLSWNPNLLIQIPISWTAQRLESKLDVSHLPVEHFLTNGSQNSITNITVQPGNSNSDGKRKLFELSGSIKIFNFLIISSLMIFSTSVYITMQIKLISRENNTFCNNCNDYAFLRQCNTVNVT